MDECLNTFLPSRSIPISLDRKQPACPCLSTVLVFTSENLHNKLTPLTEWWKSASLVLLFNFYLEQGGLLCKWKDLAILYFFILENLGGIQQAHFLKRFSVAFRFYIYSCYAYLSSILEGVWIFTYFYQTIVCTCLCLLYLLFWDLIYYDEFIILLSEYSIDSSLVLISRSAWKRKLSNLFQNTRN